ncbi:MAG TPA: hypothetical protein VLE19_03665 [Pyrinomonadaceae bacterium]|nr:hypothetical protein [Pyrinomonadaceae bacterium]
MKSRRRRASKAVATLLLFAIAQVAIQIAVAAPATSVTTPVPIPQQFVARLTTRNNQPITVNGNSATTGASILTGATIETGADQSATVNLGSLGTLDIAPNTKLVLTYDDKGNVKATIIFGCAILTAKKKTAGEVATEQGGTAGKTDPAKGGILDICFPPGAANPVVGQGAAAAAGAGAGAPAGVAVGGGGGLFGLGVPTTIAILGGIAGVAAVPLVFQDNPSGV